MIQQLANSNPTRNWHAPLEGYRSRGLLAARPGSLAGLHERRREHLGQFWTPKPLAAFVWALVEPAMARLRIQRGQGARVSLLDTSVGIGNLLQFARPDEHTLAGCDVDEDAISALIDAAEAAGFVTDFRAVGLENVRPHGYDFALLNPPFSIHLEHPSLQPYNCTAWGKYGPGTSAMSHHYAIDQAREAACVTVAIVPRTQANTLAEAAAEDLHAVIDIPIGAFRTEGTEVATSIVIFASARLPGEAVRRYAVSDLDPAAAIDLGDALDRALLPYYTAPKLGVQYVDSDTPSITLAVTGDNRVKISHDQRQLRLRYYCGLTQARVHNAILVDSIHAHHMQGHRYPRGVQWIGQGKLDLETHLMQSDPEASFNSLLNEIRDAGGLPVVDPGILGYLRRKTRALRRAQEPLARVVRTESVSAAGDTLTATVRMDQTCDPSRWLSPFLAAGQEVTLSRRDPGTFSFEHEGETFHVPEEDLQERFVVESDPSSTERWVKIHQGRLAAFPELAKQWEARIRAEGIDKFLDWDYQLKDLIELQIGPTGDVVAWDMGLGKARLSAALCLARGTARNLVVVESRLVEEMRIELAKLPISKDEWQVIEKPSDLDQLKRINVIAYSRLRLPVDRARPRGKTYAKALRRQISVLVADEGHLLASLNTQQTRALWQLSAKRRYVLSGTPIINYPRDILPVVAFTSGDGTAAQVYGLRRQHLTPDQRQHMVGASRGLDAFREAFTTMEWVTNEFAEEMQQGAKREIPKIKNVQAYRRWLAPHLKRRVVEEPDVSRYIRVKMPERTTTEIEWDSAHLSHYLRVAEDFMYWYREQRRRADESGKNVNLVAILARIQAVETAANTPQRAIDGFGAYNSLTSKQRYTLQRLTELTDAGHKTVLYARSPATLERLRLELSSRGIESVVFHGGIPIKARLNALDTYFRRGQAPVLLASIGVTEKGLNIPQANRILMYERAWTSTAEEQAIRRLIRPDQTRDVVVEYLHLAGSIDTYKAQMVEHKGFAAAAGLDYGEEQVGEGEFLHLDTILGQFVEDIAALLGCDRKDIREQLRNRAA